MNSKNKPKVSIISPSYLHEKYVAKFLNSILAQTFTDFELIIIDDRSLDNTLNIIKSYKDSRIKIIEHHYNMGPSIGFNDGIKNSVGEYIVFIASDDEVCPTYLQEGINYLEKNKQYNALFFQLEGIDENNHLLKDKQLQKILKFKNTNRFQLIREMFIYGNRLPAPGEIIRKSILKQIGFFNPALLQTQDYDFHVRTLLKNKIYIYQKPLVKYRQMINGSQIDNHSNLSILRQNLELPFVLDNFLKMDINLFIKVFSQDFKVFGKPTRETIPYFLGKIALKTDDQIRQKWGYETILNFIKDTKNLKLLNSLYSIQYKDIISLVNKINFDSKSQKINYKDTKFRKIIRKFLNKEK